MGRCRILHRYGTILRGAKRSGLLHCLRSGCRNMRIGSSPDAKPKKLKNVDLADEEVLAGEDGFFKAAAVRAIALVLDDVI